MESKDKLLFIEKSDHGFKIGLTNEAKEEFGEITFLTLPTVGKKLNEGDSFAEVEAEKAVNELVSPVSGVVEKVNERAVNDPNVLNQAEGLDAWLMEVSFAE